MSSAVYLAAAFAVGAAASYMYADDIVSFVKQFIKKRWVRVCVCVCPLRNHTHKGPSVPRDDFRGGGDSLIIICACVRVRLFAVFDERQVRER